VLESPLRVRVALFGSPALDVSKVDRSSLSFAGAAAQRSALLDVNRDGVRDLVAVFETRNMVLSTKSANARLLGSLRSSQSIQGQAPVTVVAPGKELRDSLERRRCEPIPAID
jgi:hypothetical protein